MPDNPFDDIPDVPTLEERFAFIDKDITRENATICFQYIIFLTVMKGQDVRHGPIKLSICRDIVVHTASVIDCCLHYGITRLITEGKVNQETLLNSWTNHSTGKIHEFTPADILFWIRKVKKPMALKDNPSSQDINRAARNADLIDDDLFAKAEKIREARNNIHFNGDEEVSYMPEAEIDEMFEIAGIIIESIKTRLAKPEVS